MLKVAIFNIPALAPKDHSGKPECHTIAAHSAPHCFPGIRSLFRLPIPAPKKASSIDAKANKKVTTPERKTGGQRAESNGAKMLEMFAHTKVPRLPRS
jgi:hypothetical protein